MICMLPAHAPDPEGLYATGLTDKYFDGLGFYWTDGSPNDFQIQLSPTNAPEANLSCTRCLAFGIIPTNSTGQLVNLTHRIFGTTSMNHNYISFGLAGETSRRGVLCQKQEESPGRATHASTHIGAYNFRG